MLEKTLGSPLDFKEIKPVNPEVISPKYVLLGLILRLKLHSFGLLIQRTDSLEKTLVMGNLRAEGEADDRG